MPARTAPFTAAQLQAVEPRARVAGERPAASGSSAFRLDIEGAAGTNAKADDAAFVRRRSTP